MKSDAPSQDDIQQITEQLGRVPKGMKEVLLRTPQGSPVVIRVSSIVEGLPFPNMYWLTNKKICKEIDHIESSGFIKTLEKTIIPESLSLQEKLAANHQQYIEKRWQYFEQEFDLSTISESFITALKTKGIGGLMKRDRVRCLHMHYAHHLIDGNEIGKLLEERFNLSKHIS